jgi:hypothetical protein
MKKSITLVELIISLTLVGVIVLGAVAFDLASRRLFATTENNSALVGELGYLMDHIGRNVSLATGDSSNTGIRWNPVTSTLFIRQDRNAVPVPANYAAHTWISYIFAPPNITFNGQVITPHLQGLPIAQACCDSSIQACCSQTANACALPAGFDCRGSASQGGVRLSGITLNDGAFTVGINDVNGHDTIYFFPLSHSWN